MMMMNFNQYQPYLKHLRCRLYQLDESAMFAIYLWIVTRRGGLRFDHVTLLLRGRNKTVIPIMQVRFLFSLDWSSSLNSKVWNSHMGVRTLGQMGSADPLENGWKIKKRKHAKNSSFLCLCYILRAIRAGRCTERIYFSMHYFVVKFSKFSLLLVAKGHWPP